MSEIKVGDRVKEADLSSIGTVIGRHRDREGDEWAWVETEDEEDCQCHGFLLSELTRIEPAVSQPKFSVGQEVDLVGCISGNPGVITEVRFSYTVRWGWSTSVCPEDRLQLLGGTCPTCGKADDG